MSNAPVPSPGASGVASSRRRRFALQTVVLLLAVTFACVFAGVIASSRRARAQFDLTGTRQHRLSERSLALLKGLSGTYEVVVAADMRTLEPLTRARTLDVLDGFARAGEHVRVRVIDTSSSRGVGEFDALLGDLATRYAPEIEAQRAVVGAGIEGATEQVDALNAVSASILAVRGGIKDDEANAAMLRSILDDDAAKARLASERLARSVATAHRAMEQRIGATSIPAVDEAAREIGSALAQVSNDLGPVYRRVDAVSRAADVPAGVRESMAPVVRAVRAQREAADGVVDRLARLPVLPMIAVARVLERTSAVLVIGPPGSSGAAGGVTAIEFGAMFPSRDAAPTRSGVLDLRSRAEELTATAIASLGSAKSPVVVLVHDQPVRLGIGLERFSGLIDRLRLRGIEVTEWAVAVDPDFTPRFDPARPVVYATLASAANTPEAAMRMARMANAQNRLVEEGAPILVSLNVSTRPAIGDTDPLTECLAPLGVKSNTGLPLLRQVQTPNGRVVTADMLTTSAAQSGADAQPIARAIDGLRCHFPWAVGMAPVEGSTSRFTPIVRIIDARDVWAESEWLPFAQTSLADRPYLANPPAKDSPRDDGSGDWTIAAAVEVPRNGGAVMQRAVVVGCAPWFLDDVTQATLGVVDGRPVYQAPGNIELFEAAVYWLAGQDELIARSASAEAVPLIPTMSEGQLAATKWMLIAGLPVVVLLIGAAWRLIRG